MIKKNDVLIFGNYLGKGDDYALMLAREDEVTSSKLPMVSVINLNTNLPLPPENWATTLTAPLSLPFWSRTPPEPQKRPRPYPTNTPGVGKLAYSPQKPHKPPRNRTVCSGLWTLSRKWPRAKAGVMNAGRPCTTSNKWPRR